MQQVAAHGGSVTVRLNPEAVRLLQPDGHRFRLPHKLRGLDPVENHRWVAGAVD